MNAFLHKCKLRVANCTGPKKVLLEFCLLLLVQRLNLAAIKTECIVSKVKSLEGFGTKCAQRKIRDATCVQQSNVLMSKFSVTDVRCLHNSTHPAVTFT